MLDAILLGILQGMTEFLPISSSGHLVLGEQALGMLHAGRSNLLLMVILHLGTLCAVLLAYRRDVLDLLQVCWPAQSLRLPAAERSRRRQLLLSILWASLPAAVVGLTLREPISELFGQPRLVALLLLGTAAILFLGDRLRRGNRIAEDNGPWRSLGIGAAQALAILPGISRSGSTLVAGLAAGLRPAEAARFSFLISIPAIAGAVLLEFVKMLGNPAGPALPAGALLAGFLAAAGVGYLALQWLLIAIRRRSLTLFASYCVLLSLTALLFGKL
jgi:undecaprenyl-diphosphatase